jgi:hypothetical protein
MELTEASAKIRTGNPIDDDEDYKPLIWAGVIGLKQSSPASATMAVSRPCTVKFRDLAAFAKDADFGEMLKRYDGDR